MKRKYLIILLLVMYVIPFKVFAAGGFSVSSTSITMYPGDSKTITISTSDSVGKLNISTSSGDIASVSTGSVFIDTVGEKETFTIKANSIGSTTISVVGTENYASYSDEKSLKGLTKTIRVNVVEKKEDTRSKNNKLKSLSIDGYELEKANNNNYTLNVSNDVTSINVNAAAEDAKAKVSGTGKHELKVGENNITVVITAENGAKNNINIKVTRKDGYYLSDLEKLLDNSSLTEIDIIINENDIITKEQVNKIKDSTKIVRFNYYNKEKKLIYSWKLDGTKIDESLEIITNITNTSTNEETISKLTNYSDGIYVNFKHKGNLPTGTKIKIYVGDKYESNNLVNIYHFDGNKLNIIENEVNIIDGYLEFNIKHCSEYFVTRATVYDMKTNQINKTNLTMNNFMIVSIVELFIIVVLLSIVFIKKNNQYQKHVKTKVPVDSLFMTVDNIFPIGNSVKNQ